MMKLKVNKQSILYILITAIALVPSAYCMTYSVSSNVGGFSANLGAQMQDAIKGSTVISDNGLTVQFDQSSSDGTLGLKTSHSISDDDGNNAMVGVDISNAHQISYGYGLYKGSEGESAVEARENLDVTGAGSINAYAKAFNKAGYDVDVSTVVANGDLIGYRNCAHAEPSLVGAFQSFDKASGSIQLDSKAWQLPTPSKLPLIYLERITTPKSSSTTAQGTATKYTDGAVINKAWGTNIEQTGHVTGTFTGKAIAGSSSITRASDYGKDYDLDMHAATQGSTNAVGGTIGYYVDPSMSTASLGAIQGAVDAAKAGDTINVAAGTYHENLNIDKAVTIKGTDVTVDSITNNGGIVNLVSPLSPPVPDDGNSSPITSSSKVVLLRSDDVWWTSPGFNWITSVVQDKSIASTYAVVPYYLTLPAWTGSDLPNPTIAWLNGLDPSRFETATHGYQHEELVPQSGALTYDQQYNIIKQGTDIMKADITSQPIYTYISPYDEANEDTLKACQDLGYHSISALPVTTTDNSITINQFSETGTDRFNWETDWSATGDVPHTSLAAFQDKFNNFLTSSDKYLVIVMHPNTFYTGDGTTPRTDDMDVFTQAIDWMKGQSNVVFSTFNQAYNWDTKT